MGESFETESGVRVTLSRPRSRLLVLSPEEVSHHVSHRVESPSEDRQFLVTHVDVQGTQYPTRTDLPLAVELDGERYRGDPIRVGRSDSEFEGEMGLPVPVIDAAEGLVVWERRAGPSPRWEIPDGTLETLAAAPDFSVESVAVPDSVREGEQIPVEFTVANTGERDGRFLTEFGFASGSVDFPEMRVTVPAGDTVTQTERLPDWATTTFEDSVRLAMDWGDERRTWDIDIEPATTTANGSQ